MLSREINFAEYCFTKFKMHFVSNHIPDYLWKSLIHDVGQANPIHAKVQKDWDLLRHELRDNPGMSAGLSMFHEEVRLRSKMTKGWV